MELNDISGIIIDKALKVHSTLGPGLLESAYEACLLYELQKAELKVLSQVTLPIVYEGIQLDAGYRLDLLVEDEIIIELKSVDVLQPIHQAQLLTYLRLSKKKLGLLINFNELHLKNGIKRLVHNL